MVACTVLSGRDGEGAGDETEDGDGGRVERGNKGEGELVNLRAIHPHIYIMLDVEDTTPGHSAWIAPTARAASFSARTTSCHPIRARWTETANAGVLYYLTHTLTRTHIRPRTQQQRTLADNAPTYAHALTNL